MGLVVSHFYRMTAGRPSLDKGLNGQPGRRSGGTERTISLLILAALAVVATGVVLKQFCFNPAVLGRRAGLPITQLMRQAHELLG